MTGKRILVVDDERIVNLDIQATLKRLGYAIAGDAVSGQDAIEKTSRLKPDLVLMDIKLSGAMDGVEASNFIIKSFDIPVVFLTAYSDEQTLNRAKLSGPFGYLLKPFEERDLRSAIEIALYKHSMEQEFRQAVHDAQAANEAKSSFLATISHELRTPMNGILGLSEILMNSGLDSEQQEYVELIKGSANSLLRVLNDLLDYSKIERRILELREGLFDPRRTLALIMNTHSSQAAKKGLQMECFIHPEISGEIKGDSGRLMQVLNNLISNAIKYTDKGGICVEVMPDDYASEPYPDGCVRLLFAVSDTGVGISRDKADTIFESFTQLEDYMTRKHGGIGLGLTISYNLVNMLKGTMWLETEPCVGSSFFFTAVFRTSSETELSSNSDTDEVENRIFNSMKRVLLADDNIITRRVVSAFLEKANCDLDIVENGRDVLVELQKKKYDMVVMDIQMPVMDGLEATRIIRSGSIPEIDPETPILALTAHAMKGDRERCLEVGMNGYLSKPFRSSGLLEAMNMVIDGAGGTEERTECCKPNAQDSSCIDFNSVIERLDGNVDLLREIYTHFIELVPRHIAKMETCADSCDVEGLKVEIMALRGLAMDVGAHGIQVLTDEMEKNISCGDILFLEKFVSRVRAEADKTLAVMADHIFKSA
ncbi:response regulator [Maridesulfovibrio sp.]|uniref:hybrid sensor histidine kinase/response regulator n=1 Tax=Maridesulfovibrio sp. TaxID=2795000 RepID=UPI002A189E9C|nr:response regulator [Maridesulfovibrio sp.]